MNDEELRQALHVTLRHSVRWLVDNEDYEDVSPPHIAALVLAQTFIDALDTRCLGIKCCLSTNGEINFIYGWGHSVFQILILKDSIAFHGKTPTSEYQGDVKRVEDFPQSQLIEFATHLGNNKQ